jgi:DNA invertase Pin-like site-specific DNA recombinase
MRTSSSTNVGEGKDSEKRQLTAIENYAKAAGFLIVDWFYDAAVKGSDPVTVRPGFAAMLDRITGNGVRTVLVESPDRFARNLAVQLAGHDYLKRLGVDLIPTSAPDFFIEDTPSAVLIRQVLGAVSEFQEPDLVVKLRVARERKREKGRKVGGGNPSPKPVRRSLRWSCTGSAPDSSCARSARSWRRPAMSRSSRQEARGREAVLAVCRPRDDRRLTDRLHRADQADRVKTLYQIRPKVPDAGTLIK